MTFGPKRATAPHRIPAQIFLVTSHTTPLFCFWSYGPQTLSLARAPCSKNSPFSFLVPLTLPLFILFLTIKWNRFFFACVNPSKVLSDSFVAGFVWFLIVPFFLQSPSLRTPSGGTLLSSCSFVSYSYTLEFHPNLGPRKVFSSIEGCFPSFLRTKKPLKPTQKPAQRKQFPRCIHIFPPYPPLWNFHVDLCCGPTLTFEPHPIPTFFLPAPSKPIWTSPLLFSARGVWKFVNFSFFLTDGFSPYEGASNPTLSTLPAGFREPPSRRGSSAAHHQGSSLFSHH